LHKQAVLVLVLVLVLVFVRWQHQETRRRTIVYRLLGLKRLRAIYIDWAGQTPRRSRLDQSFATPTTAPTRPAGTEGAGDFVSFHGPGNFAVYRSRELMDVCVLNLVWLRRPR